MVIDTSKYNFGTRQITITCVCGCTIEYMPPSNDDFWSVFCDNCKVEWSCKGPMATRMFTDAEKRKMQNDTTTEI